MASILRSSKTLVISGIIILGMFTILIIKGIAYRDMTNELESDSINDSSSVSNSYYPEGSVFSDLDKDGYLEKNPLSNAAIISAFNKAVELNSWLKGSDRLDLDTNDVKYHKDGSKNIPYYRVNSKCFDSRAKLIAYSNKLFNSALTDKLTNDFYCNTVSEKTIYVFNDFDNKLYELGGNIISNLSFDYSDYCQSKREYSIGVNNNNKIVVRLTISFNSDITKTSGSNYNRSARYEYVLEKDTSGLWRFSDFYSPINLCNDLINSMQNE